jgi:tetratricopeptide (TPR) repeat protein
LAGAAERKATTEAAIARAVNDFLLKDLLGQFDSVPQFRDEFGGNPDLTVIEAIDRAAAKIGERFQDQPILEAAIRTVIGEGYASLARYPLASAHLERAATLRKAHLGPDHPDTLASMGNLAGAYAWAARYSDAIALRQQLLDYRRALLGPDDPETLACVCNLARAYEFAGRWDKSVPLLEQTVEKQRTIWGPTHASTLETMRHLARHYYEVDRVAESMELHQKVLEKKRIVRFTEGPDQGPTMQLMTTFALVCQRAGKLDQADQLLRDALDLEKNLKREDSVGRRTQRANILGFLALNLLMQKRYDEAEPLIRQVVASLVKRYPDVFRCFFWLSLHGAVLSGQQRYAEAEPLLLQGYEGMKQREATPFVNERRLLTDAGKWVVRFYEATNQPDKARAWQEKVQSPVHPK